MHVCVYVWYSVAEIHDAELFDALSRYRMDYRRHRMGAARGGRCQVPYKSVALSAVLSPRHTEMDVRMGLDQLVALVLLWLWLLVVVLDLSVLLPSHWNPFLLLGSMRSGPGPLTRCFLRWSQIVNSPPPRAHERKKNDTPYDLECLCLRQNLHAVPGYNMTAKGEITALVMGSTPVARNKRSSMKVRASSSLLLPRVWRKSHGLGANCGPTFHAFQESVGPLERRREPREQLYSAMYCCG